MNGVSKIVMAKSHLLLWVALANAGLQDCGCQTPEHKTEVSGKADVLRVVPKKHAELVDVSVADRKVRLHIEGEPEPSDWTLTDDAEIKINAWWGRIDHLHIGDRVWVWFAIDRKKQPSGILMIADEISEQHVHGQPASLINFDAKAKTVSVRHFGAERTLQLPEHVIVKPHGEEFQLTVDAQTGFSLKMGDSVFVQSNRRTARNLLNADMLQDLQNQQKSALKGIWRNQGLPGSITILHPMSGELEVILDHEAIRWGRHLSAGDSIKLQADSDSGNIAAQVKSVRPWRERTRVQLATNSGVDQLDLVTGQRIQVFMPEPPVEAQNSDLPMGIDRPRAKNDRIEWILSSVYCPCEIKGDQCTGMFYTQASCSWTACGMPKKMTAQISDLIDEGKTDTEILHELREVYGSILLKQHLLR